MALVGRETVVQEARRALRERRHLLLVGPSGSGRTTLVRVLQGHLTADDRRHHLIAGHDSLGGIPLAAVAPLVTATGIDTGVESDVALAAYTRLPPALKAQDAVVLVDDLDLVDRATAVLVAQLVRAGVQLVITACDEPSVPQTVADALDPDSTTVVFIPLLEPDHVLSLAAAELGDELDVPSAARLVTAGAGLPERVTELIRAGRAGLVRGPAGIALGTATLTDVLRYRVSERLELLDLVGRELVELVCVAEELPESELDPVAADAAVEARALARRDQGGVVVLTPVDDVLRDAVLEVLGPATTRARRRRALELLVGVRALAAQRALLAIEDGRDVSAPEVLDAVQGLASRHRYADADLLLERCPGTDDPRLPLLRGTTRSALNDLDAAAIELSAAAAVAGPDLLPAVGRELGLLHAVRRGDPATAVELVTAVAERLGLEAGRPLAADLVKWRLMAGLPASEVPGGADLTVSAERVGVAVVSAMIASLDGPLTQAHEIVRDGLADAAATASAPAYSEDLLALSHYLVLAFDGRVAEAELLARTRRDAALVARHPAMGMWEYATAELGLHTGRLQHSKALASRAARHLAWHDFTGLRDAATALLAALTSRCGDLDAAVQLQGEVPDEARSDVKIDLHLARVDAAVAAQAGAVDRAAEILAVVARRALDESHGHLGLMALDEAFLIAREPSLRHELAAVLEGNAERSPLFAALSLRANAELSADPRAIEGAAGSLSDVGMHGRAVQALGTALVLHEKRGASEAVRRLNGRIGSMTATYGVVGWPHARAADALSSRELEIAQLAARRSRSKEIATALDLSVRTVDNHLGRVFRKLGVSSRDELAEMLGVGTD